MLAFFVKQNDDPTLKEKLLGLIERSRELEVKITAILENYAPPNADHVSVRMSVGSGNINETTLGCT